MAELPALPEGMAACGWCGAGLQLRNGELPSTCRFCGLRPQDGIRTAKAAKARKTSSRRGSVARARITPLNPDPIGEPILGVDPGSKYTGVVIRDGDAVLYASTLVCPEKTTPVDWSRLVLDELKVLLAARANLPIAIEGVSDPKGFFRGSRSPINPGHLMRAAIVLGSVVGHFTDAVIISPGGNGSQTPDHYPDCLVGRRPGDLPGSGNGSRTRNHEQSAYDVAGKGARQLNDMVNKSVNTNSFNG